MQGLGDKVGQNGKFAKFSCCGNFMFYSIWPPWYLSWNFIKILFCSINTTDTEYHWLFRKKWKKICSHDYFHKLLWRFFSVVLIIWNLPRGPFYKIWKLGQNKLHVSIIEIPLKIKKKIWYIKNRGKIVTMRIHNREGLPSLNLKGNSCSWYVNLTLFLPGKLCTWNTL